MFSNYSSTKNSLMNLMIVGPPGHGKSTLLMHLKKTKSQPVTFFDRQTSYITRTTRTTMPSNHSVCREGQLGQEIASY